MELRRESGEHHMVRFNGRYRAGISRFWPSGKGTYAEMCIKTQSSQPAFKDTSAKTAVGFFRVALDIYFLCDVKFGQKNSWNAHFVL